MMVPHALVTIMTMYMAIGTVAITGEEESCALQIIPTCVQIPEDHPHDWIMLVTKTARPQDKEATGNVGNEVWFYLISYFMGLMGPLVINMFLCSF